VDVEEKTLKALLELLKQDLAAAEALLDKASKNPDLERELAETRKQIKEVQEAMAEN
jgi:hypothetical protein